MINYSMVKSEKGAYSLSQIFLLVFGIVAVAWMIGSEVGVVSASKDFYIIKSAGGELYFSYNQEDWYKVSETTLTKTQGVTQPLTVGAGGTYAIKDGYTGEGTTTEKKLLADHEAKSEVLKIFDYKYKSSSSQASYNINLDAMYAIDNTGYHSTNEFTGAVIPTKTANEIDGLEKLYSDSATIQNSEEGQSEASQQYTSTTISATSSSDLAKLATAGTWISYKNGEDTVAAKVVEVAGKDGTKTYNLVDTEGKVIEKGVDASKVDGLSEATWLQTEGGVWGVTKTIGGNFLWAIGVFGAMQTIGSAIGSFAGLESEEIMAASLAASTGLWVGKSVGDLMAKPNEFNWKWGLGTGIAVGALVFYATYKKEKYEVVTYSCGTWQAPTGGNFCEACNDQGILPCSEYQCKSLGQSCELLNSGTEEESCVWVNRNDVKFPIIEPWEDALLEDYKYTPDSAISPPDRGVIIEYTESTDKCIKAFTPFEFGVITDEPAKCKIDYTRAQNFSDMSYWFGGSQLYKYNHTQTLSLPGPSALEAENITLENGGDFELFVKCMDANGNFNTGEFVFKYCVEDGPDTTPPIIKRTSPLNKVPILYNQSSMDIQIYTNEPAECRWSHLDQSFDEMTEEFSCARSAMQMNAEMLYECEGTLTGLEDEVENDFYFRCKDKPSARDEDRNANAQSYPYTLYGTIPLVIDEIEPNDTIIKASTDSVKVTLEVKTSAGYNEGESTCYYSTDEDDDYVMFYNTSSYKHSQDLWLNSGYYTYYIKCVDLGGNTDIKSVSFETESDVSAPIVARAFHEGTYLKLITNENATCVYSTDDCNYLFDDGLSMVSVENVEHYTDWTTNQDFYIKCEDEFGNQPGPDECSIIVRPFKDYSDDED